MQDQNPSTNDTTNPKATENAPAAANEGNGVAIEASATPGAAPKVVKTNVANAKDFVRKIGEKIKNSENILVALSRNPSVDEMSAAIGLTLFLDSLQKHTTAIYSGKTPDALEFLRPDKTFETNTASLQDFIIALNKDKADHLRYKLEGDFVKVFITPYKTTITEKDLDFSRGDFNVDLVLALNVPSAGDLDEALAEHGRIMHNATAVDITVGTPGRFGEIEWSDPSASSVSQMVAELIFGLKPEDTTLDVDIATALLTGIVAATQRFSNDRTSAAALNLASKLMSLGADQQLISAHVMDNVPKIDEDEDEVIDVTSEPKDKSNLAVDHTASEGGEAMQAAGAAAQEGQTAMPEAEQMSQMPQVPQELQAVQQDLAAQAGVPGGMPGNNGQNLAENNGLIQPTGGGLLEPVQGMDVSTTMTGPEPPKDYAAMMAEALAETSPIAVTPEVGAPGVPEMNRSYMMPNTEAPIEAPPAMAPETVAQNLPVAPQAGAMMNGEAMPEGNVVLPPPPTPPAAVMPEAGNVAPATGPEANPPVLPEVQVPVEMPELPQPGAMPMGNEAGNMPGAGGADGVNPAAAAAPAPAEPQAPVEPGAFQIPGM